MDLQSVKYGLGIATVSVAGIIFLFALYLKLAGTAQKSFKKKE